jgi:hypothetical protein
MTIASLIPTNRYLGDGVQTEFPVSFPIFGDGRHVKAVISKGNGSTLEEQELAYGLDYSVSALACGGACVTAAPVPAGQTLTLYLELPYAQPRDFDNLGRLDAEELEKGLDYLTALAAQNAAGIARALLVPVGDPQSPREFLRGVFDAGGAAHASAAEACARAEEAGQSARDACACAARAEQAREVAIAQTLAANELMAAEMAKINLITGALRDNMRELGERIESVPAGDDNALAELERRILVLEELVASIANATPGNAPVAMPLATADNGIGQIVTAQSATVPPGGTWLVFGYAATTLGDISGRFFPNSASGLHVGIYAGGTTIPGLYAHAGLICWRIA